MKKAENLPLVTLIVRTKNRPTLLAEALQSIAKQTYPKIEIIVVNDGGDDVSEITLPFNGLNITIVLLQFPAGLGRSKAANAGLDKAAGKYIAFLDDAFVDRSTGLDGDCDLGFDQVRTDPRCSQISIRAGRETGRLDRLLLQAGTASRRR